MNWFVFSAFFLLIVGGPSSILARFASKEVFKCDVGIVGGGFSGLYMAYRLLKSGQETQVCIFEKDSSVGGRIRDYRFQEAPDVHVGLGAWRIDKEQDHMLHLVDELGITHTEWTFVEPTMIESRGIKSSNHEDIKKGYPSLLAHPVFGNMTSSELSSYAYKPENVAKADQYATVVNYYSDIITPEGGEYLSELYGYKGDFTDFIQPRGYIEFMEEAEHFTGKYVRPKGGMSSIITKLEEKVKKMGARIFTDTRVKRLLKRADTFLVVTPLLRVKSKKLILATSPEDFKEIAGPVARHIQDTDEFNSIQPIPAFKGAAVYETAWWENLEVGGTPVKAGQRYISSSNCLGSSLAHRDKGLNGEGVLHTMYTDGECARRWDKIAKMDENYIDAEVHRALETKYGTKIPKPIDTAYQYWHSAWHFQKPGTTFTMADVNNWAKRPLAGNDVFVVGEAYHLYRGWCEGAIISCKNALQEGWGIEMDKVGVRSIREKKDLSKVMLSKQISRP